MAGETQYAGDFQPPDKGMGKNDSDEDGKSRNDSNLKQRIPQDKRKPGKNDQNDVVSDSKIEIGDSE